MKLYLEEMENRMNYKYQRVPGSIHSNLSLYDAGMEVRMRGRKKKFPEYFYWY